jgi:Zn finger protein HypA/HybF involved in hydrogenase expression
MQTDPCRLEYFKQRRANLRAKRRCERCGDVFPHGQGHVNCPECRSVKAEKERVRRVAHKLVF